ncbi:MAG: lysoplasmalogenase, partial [Treponema sp.]|nr:lysoplasmalogenase [Treponema sp.]
MSVVVLALFAVAGTVHIVALVFKSEGVRRISKVCLMPLLISFYLVRADRFLPPLVLAGVLGWLGDIFLIRIQNNRYFKLGLASFLLGHLCYIWAILSLTGYF